MLRMSTWRQYRPGCAHAQQAAHNGAGIIKKLILGVGVGAAGNVAAQRPQRGRKQIGDNVNAREELLPGMGLAYNLGAASGHDEPASVVRTTHHLGAWRDSGKQEIWIWVD